MAMAKVMAKADAYHNHDIVVTVPWSVRDEKEPGRCRRCLHNVKKVAVALVVLNVARITDR